MSNNVIDSIKGSLDSVLSVREKLGAVIKPVYLITRTWSGGQVGAGQFRDDVVPVKPTPGFKDYSHDLRLTAGGAVEQGDIIIKGISKASYPEQVDVDCSSQYPGVEKFYRLGDDDLYQVISVREKYLTWNVQVRKLRNGK